MPPVHLHFENVAALRHMAQSVPFSNQYNQRKVQSFLTNPNGDWLGIEGGAPAALAALVDGYPAGENLVRHFHDQIACHLPRALGHHRAKRRGNFGDEVDVHSVLRGAFDRAWTSSTRAIRKGTGILRLVVDIGANDHTSAEELRWRGIAGLALAEVMGKAGYSVEIVAGFAIRNLCATGNKKMMFTTVVKPRSTQADIGLLAATVALPGFFRTLGFAAVVRAADDQGVNVDSGLGNYLDVSGVLPVPDKVTQLFVPQSVVDEQGAVDWVKATVTLLQGVAS